MRMRIWPHTACIQPLARTAGWPFLQCTEAQWQALCEVIQRPDLGHDSRFTTLAARLTHRAALDTIVVAWTQAHSAQEAEAMLQARGVPASAVHNSQELYNDPQLTHRGHFVELPSRSMARPRSRDRTSGYHGRQHGSSVPGQHSGGITSTCWRLSWAIVPSASRR